jgi:hypothetical protein
VVLEPVPGRAFLLKSEWSVSRPEIPKIPKSEGLGETAGGGGKSRYGFHLGMEVYHSLSYGPSYGSFERWPQPSTCLEHLKSVLRELLLSKTGVGYG